MSEQHRTPSVPYQDAYSHIRGFNFQPPWGSNGRDIWLHFDPTEYRRILRCAKAAFPKLNTIRVWLGFEAWYDDDVLCLQNVRRAAEILAEEKLHMIPVYFNGWRSTPDFGGGLHSEGLSYRPSWEILRRYLRETAEMLESTGAVLVTDICNEPFNGVKNSKQDLKNMVEFLECAADDLHRYTTAPVTVSTQGEFWFSRPLTGHMTDQTLIAHFLDVLSFHPYLYGICEKPEEHPAWIAKMIEEAKWHGKPLMITECCWGAATDEERGEIVRQELGNYAAAGVGFVAHALSDSKVADLHQSDKNSGLYMPFLHLDGTIRPYHECYNLY